MVSTSYPQAGTVASDAVRTAPELIELIASRDAVIGVVGLGYVGLPAAVSFAAAGFTVTGIDLDRSKVEAVNSGRSHVRDVSDEQLAKLRHAKRLRAYSGFRALRQADAILICVPTPLEDGAPDLSRVRDAASALSRWLKPGALVVLESTTYPGTTEEVVAPLLETGGLRAGRDFLLAFSPERIDPGNELYRFEDIPKVVGGLDEDSTRAAAALYEQVTPKVLTVTSPREAELAKLIENTFRHVNIALINELAVYAHELGIDIWEAIQAAATKPFGFMPFWPGPGWGGHCIPLDPAYLSYRVRRERAHEVRFVELAHAINSEMPRHVVDRITVMLSDAGKPLRGADVLCIGAAYKGGTEDTRESPALKVMTALQRRGARVSYHDPLVPRLRLAGLELESRPLSATGLCEHDLVVILAPQIGVNWDLIAAHGRLIFDCCNALGIKNHKVVRL